MLTDSIVKKDAIWSHLTHKQLQQTKIKELIFSKQNKSRNDNRRKDLLQATVIAMKNDKHSRREEIRDLSENKLRVFCHI